MHLKIVAALPAELSQLRLLVADDPALRRLLLDSFLESGWMSLVDLVDAAVLNHDALATLGGEHGYDATFPSLFSSPDDDNDTLAPEDALLLSGLVADDPGTVAEVVDACWRQSHQPDWTVEVSYDLARADVTGTDPYHLVHTGRWPGTLTAEYVELSS